MEDDSPQSLLTNTLSSLNEFNPFQYFEWDMAVLPGILIMILLIILSAIVSGSEVAFFSFSQEQISNLDVKHKKAQRIKRFLDNPEKLLGTILVGNNLFNVAFIMVSYFVIHNLFDFKGNLLAENFFNLVIITSILVLFGEIIPKTYAAKSNMKMAFKSIDIISLVYMVASPLVIALNQSSGIIQKRLSRKESSMTDADINKAIEMTVGPESSEQNHNILKEIVKFGNTSVKQIMQSRVDVVSFDVSDNFIELINTIRDSGYSRIPIYEGSFDNITGILYAKDLLASLDEGPDFNWQQLQRPAFYVPESKKIDDLLDEFRQKRVHMAIVVDEYGGASGLVTLEDVLEEVIGEIQDEFDDIKEIGFKKIDEHSYLFQGKTQLNDVCRAVSLPLNTFNDVKGDADTLAGLILEITGSLPKSGDVIPYKKYTFRIITVNNIRIVRVQLTINGNVEVAA